eukprot:scaffold125183_cov27-Tisochrysis_lutea.AAC.3
MKPSYFLCASSTACRRARSCPRSNRKRVFNASMCLCRLSHRSSDDELAKDQLACIDEERAAVGSPHPSRACFSPTEMPKDGAVLCPEERKSECNDCHSRHSLVALPINATATSLSCGTTSTDPPGRGEGEC